MSDRRLGNDHTNGERGMPSMTSYLSRMRNLVLSNSVASKSSSTVLGVSQKPVLVMGNPSADLDSFISAVVTSFCYNLAGSDTAHPRKPTYIPVLNLPSVKASDLWRLRPEFGVAVRLALGESPDTIGRGGQEQGKTDVLKELITIADIKADEGSTLHKLFNDSKTTETPSSHSTEKLSLFLVDHNSPSIPGLSDEAISARFTVSSCIDHHVDENYVPQDADPRIVTTGIGSCTSLVVKHLREQGMWPSSSSQHSEEQTSSNPQVDPQALQQISKLALAPILIDTWNLKAKGDKCSDTDREAVRFLESVIATTATTTTAQTEANPPQSSSETHFKPGADGWDRDAFFSCISTAKANSLDLLTMQEVFDRDYKAWTEHTSVSGSGCGCGKQISIGISSLVKPLSWLVSHAAGGGDGGDGTDAAESFVSEIEKFATAPDRQLGVFCMLTRTADGRKEVAVLVLDEAAKGALDAFERNSRHELKLTEWVAGDDWTTTSNSSSNSSSGGSKTVNALAETLSRRIGEKGEWKIWWMGDTSKSRKQVGPLLREAVRSI